MKRPERQDSTIIPGIANPLLKRAMDLYDVEIEDDETDSTEEVTIEDYRNLETTVAVQDAEDRGLSPIVIGNGDKVVKQSIENGSQVMPSEKLLFLTNGKQPLMPDTLGWSTADLIKFGDMLDIEVKFDGDGYCVQQSLAPYEALNDTVTELTFKMKEN